MAETFTRTYTRDDGETEVEVEITVNSWGSLGSYWEPPEGMEVEITGATLLESDTKVTLTDAECERMEVAFCEDPPEPDCDDYDE